MFRILPYIALFFTAVIAQLFIFDPLSASVFIAPLVYILFIVLLPVGTSQLVMLAMGALLGVVMDATMGTHGLNSIATIFVAYFRAPLIRLLMGREKAADRGTPSAVLFGDSNYFIYLVVMIAAHHLIFFIFEALSTTLIFYTFVRCIISTAISTLFVWLIANAFVNNKIIKS